MLGPILYQVVFIFWFHFIHKKINDIYSANISIKTKLKNILQIYSVYCSCPSWQPDIIEWTVSKPFWFWGNPQTFGGKICIKQYNFLKKIIVDMKKKHTKGRVYNKKITVD